MDRREYLKASGLLCPAIAGCLTNSDRIWNNLDRTVSIKEVDSLPSNFLYELNVSITENGITENHTAQFEITTSNDSEEIRTVSIPFYKTESALYGRPGIFIYAVSAPDSPSPDSRPECASDGTIEVTQEGYHRQNLHRVNR